MFLRANFRYLHSFLHAWVSKWLPKVISESPQWLCGDMPPMDGQWWGGWVHWIVFMTSLCIMLFALCMLSTLCVMNQFLFYLIHICIHTYIYIYNIYMYVYMYIYIYTTLTDLFLGTESFICKHPFFRNRNSFATGEIPLTTSVITISTS